MRMRFLRSYLIEPLKIILVLPFALAGVVAILLFLVLVLVFGLPIGVIDHLRWKSKLKAQGRYKNREFSPEKLHHGTLIVDVPSLGWNDVYCWWTPDDIQAVCPCPIVTREVRVHHMRLKDEEENEKFEFEHWLCETYLSADTGSAILLHTRRSKQFADELRFLAPGLSVVNTWSGLINTVITVD